MFSKAELLEHLPSLADLPVGHLEVEEFGQKDFKVPESEQMIEVHRGRKADFEDALQFWLGSLQLQDWNSDDYFVNYAKNCLCLSLTEERFVELVADYSGSLKKPLKLVPQGRFIAALQMHDEWNDVALLGGFDAEYIAFYWATTA